MTLEFFIRGLTPPSSPQFHFIEQSLNCYNHVTLEGRGAWGRGVREFRLFLHPGMLIGRIYSRVHHFRILLLLAFAWVSDIGMAQLADLVPRPGLSPDQVVQYQVAALQQNDDPTSDAGIERVFRFASPTNKQVTGPLQKFVQIVKSPAYSPLLNSRSSAIIGSELKGDQAKIAVKIVSLDGRPLTYVFILSKQSEGEYRDCWMTDGVAPLKEAEDGPDQGVTI
jgi:hypothetical protein